MRLFDCEAVFFECLTKQFYQIGDRETLQSCKPFASETTHTVNQSISTAFQLVLSNNIYEKNCLIISVHQLVSEIITEKCLLNGCCDFVPFQLDTDLVLQLMALFLLFVQHI